jgi:membrane-associated phospholipid phosphatase
MEMIATAILIGAALLLYLAPLDDELIDAVRGLNRSSTNWKRLARELSFFGDFLGFNLLMFVGLQVAGWSLRSRKLLRVAVASLLCACLAGAAANVLRVAVGRPRPGYEVAGRAWQPSVSDRFNSFPSAHTATAFGGALPVLLSHPVVGVPASIVATGVAWSRVRLNRHHLTDVIGSAFLALLMARPLGRWAMNGGSANIKTRVSRSTVSDVLVAS